MIEVTGKGDFKKTRDFFDKIKKGEIYSELDRYGRAGVDALAQATPVDSGLTASSWEYRVIRGKKPGVRWLNWHNTHKTDAGTPVAVLIQYGHGTRAGTFVQGRDYINPAILPLFDLIANNIWEKVKSS